ncbi:hypothetical protein PWT90_09956 [Aphanocladium album]|nr:hypothetical protein PWT90_09956 [Aphanocladium album]
MVTNTTSVPDTAQTFLQRAWSTLLSYSPWIDLNRESQDTVLSIDAAPNDCLYRIRRSICGHARIVYVRILSNDFIPQDDRTFGPAILRRLSDLDEWHREWKTLTISASADNLRIDVDIFKPHSLSPEHVHDCYPLYDIADISCQEHMKTRTWRCSAPGAQVYLKLARFQFEIRALEQEVKAYNLLHGSGLAPEFVGYVYEETPDRVVGFITEQVIGRYPNDASDFAACLVALRGLHEKGIVHGDLNKHNIIITEDGPKFIDFEESIVLLDQARNWEQCAQGEEQNLLASLSDQSGKGAPWQQ